MDYQDIISLYLDALEKYINDIVIKFNIKTINKLIVKNIYINNSSYEVIIDLPSELKKLLDLYVLNNSFDINLNLLFDRLFPTISGYIIITTDIILKFNIPTSYYDLPKEIVKETLYNLTYTDIINFCNTNKQYSHICEDEIFWKVLLLKYINESDIKSIYKNNYKNTFKFYNDVMLENKYATLHVVRSDENVTSDRNATLEDILDSILTNKSLKSFLVRQGDIIENLNESGYRSDGRYMLDIIDNEIKIISLNYDIDDYGSPNERFTYPDFPADYWNDNKLKVIGGKPKSYWHSYLPPIVINKHINNKKYYACVIKNIEIPWYMTYNYKNNEYILFLNWIEEDKIIDSIIEISGDSLMNEAYDLFRPTKYPSYNNIKLKNMELYVYSISKSDNDFCKFPMTKYEKEISDQLKIKYEHATRYYNE